MLCCLQHLQAVQFCLHRLKKSHSLELASLAKKYEQELSDSEHKLKADLESRLADMRGKLAAHLLEEEQRIKTEETKCFEEIKKKLQEEQDEEEAQLYEEKTNAIIKLKQQVVTTSLVLPSNNSLLCASVNVHMCTYIRTYVHTCCTHTTNPFCSLLASG